jgi:hypothetical protein
MRTLIFLSIFAAGCGGSEEPLGASSKPLIENPTGSCVAPDDGSRAGYHTAGGATWLLDCKNPLKREYWRVFAQSSTSAFMIPRPDAAPELQDACSNGQHPLHSIVEKYALCGPADAETVKIVNDMLPADALDVAHYLHTRLKFVAMSKGIAPFAPPTDILDACALRLAENSSELTYICDRERQRLESGQEIAFSYEGPGAVELAARLNELYGIP